MESDERYPPGFVIRAAPAGAPNGADLVVSSADLYTLSLVELERQIPDQTFFTPCVRCGGGSKETLGRECTIKPHPASENRCAQYNGSDEILTIAGCGFRKAGQLFDLRLS